MSGGRREPAGAAVDAGLETRMRGGRLGWRAGSAGAGRSVNPPGYSASALGG